jgi:hypothetical protein
MTRFKLITHWIAATLVTVAAFAVSPAGQALIAQYPKLSAAAGLLASLAALYHSPKVA